MVSQQNSLLWKQIDHISGLSLQKVANYSTQFITNQNDDTTGCVLECEKDESQLMRQCSKHLEKQFIESNHTLHKNKDDRNAVSVGAKSVIVDDKSEKQSRLDQLESELHVSLEKNTLLEVELCRSREKIQELSKCVEDLRRESIEVSSVNDCLQAELRIMKEKQIISCEENMKIKESLHKREKEFIARLVQSEKKISTKTIQYEELETEIKLLRHSLLEEKENVHIARECELETKSRLDGHMEDYASKIQSLRQETDLKEKERKEEYENMIRYLEVKVRATEERETKLQSTLNQTSNQIAKDRILTEEKISNHKLFLENEHSKELNLLRSQRESQNLQIECLRDELGALRIKYTREIELSMQKHDEMKNEISLLKQTNFSISEQCDQLKKQFSSANALNDSYENKIENLNDDWKVKMDGKNEGLVKIRKKLENERNQKDKEIFDCQMKLNQYIRHNKMLQTELESQKDQCMKSLSSLEQSIISSTTDIFSVTRQKLHSSIFERKDI